MGYRDNPDNFVPNRVNDFKTVLRSGTEFAVIRIALQRIAMGMLPNLLQSIFDFIDNSATTVVV
jgi:hypothetical protein